MTELTRRQGYVEFGSSDHLIKENELLRETIKDRDITIQKMTDSAEIQKLRMIELENENAKLKEMVKAKRKFELVQHSPWGS